MFQNHDKHAVRARRFLVRGSAEGGRASCKIAGEIHPDILGVVCSWDDGTRDSHGNWALGGSVGSGDNALLSSFFLAR